MQVRPGDIGFGGKRKGFYPSAVRWLTNSRWSHCFVVMPEYLGEISVMEADLKVQLVPFQKEYIEKNDDYYEVWRPIKATPDQIQSAAAKLYRKNAGDIYGFLQILWFAARQILGKAGVKLEGKNWFPSGEICSETLWQYLVDLGGEYEELVSNLGEDECSPEDLYLCKLRPDLFTIVLIKS